MEGAPPVGCLLHEAVSCREGLTDGAGRPEPGDLRPALPLPLAFVPCDMTCSGDECKHHDTFAKRRHA